jgi:hypothetical protein
MSSKKLRRVGLSPELCDRLSRYQIVNCQVTVMHFYFNFMHKLILIVISNC